jgi:ectoine hydroxylase-related dioxygenase (phytanoyl-CoA dioxygenase family)
MSLDTHGYAVIASFLNRPELQLFGRAVDDVLSSARHTGMSRPGNDLVPLRWNDPIVRLVLGSERHIRRMRDVLDAPDLKWLSGYLSLKAPHSPALWWHQDWWCWDHRISFARAATQVALVSYLTDTDVRNGALRVLPGSHHASTPIHRHLPEPHGAEANELPSDHAAMSDCPGQITLSLKAGDAVVLDYRLLHGTHPNETEERRDCILLSFIPAWRPLPSEIKAHLAAHPALPDHTEERLRTTSGYDGLLPRFSGVPASIPVNRVPPAYFRLMKPSAPEG